MLMSNMKLCTIKMSPSIMYPLYFTYHAQLQHGGHNSMNMRTAE